jgi:predicted porin
MKKTLIALAALGVVGAASAQVTITGGVAAGIQTTFKSSTANFHMTNADITFTAKEDLGGGLSVAAQTNISNEALWGNATAANNTSLNLSGGFGSLTYMNILSGAAKMGGPSVEVDLTDVLGGYAMVNVANYTSPEVMPGLKVALEWSATSNGDVKAGGTPSIIGLYTAGAANVYLNNGGSGKNWDLRVNYDAGMVKLAARATKEKRTEFGVSIPAGALTYSFNTVADNKDSAGIKGSGVGVSYALSKRTALTFGYVSSAKAKDSAATGNMPYGSNYRLNLAHSF